MKNKKKEIVEIEIPSKSLRVRHAMCPNKHNLMDEEHLINGYPSITVLARYGDKEGLIHLDPVYGSFTNIYEIDLPEGECVELFCPTCRVSLSEHGQICDECLAPMFAIYLPHGGMIDACLRVGCHHHMLRFTDSEEIAKRLLDEDAFEHMP
ncbi:MAG: hypothetical protein ONA69_07305 [candidate division KSB1 bacterium]|nr:hypothetical protein [candidate division KSB1 bacterium]MDZ7346587.1 hypothetical protein [candidate division KSB1 bacterium]